MSVGIVRVRLVVDGWSWTGDSYGVSQARNGVATPATSRLPFVTFAREEAVAPVGSVGDGGSDAHGRVVAVHRYMDFDARNPCHRGLSGPGGQGHTMLVLGDAHADDPDRRRALFAAYRAADTEVALQLGDLMYYDLPYQTYFIGGNNEDFDVIESLRHGRVRSSSVRNVTLLSSTLAEVKGLRIAGLSGNFAPTQFEKPRSALVGDRRRHFVRADVDRAKQLEDVDVFLAHEAPHGTDVAEDYSVGCTHIDDILRTLEPDLCIVGHHHQHEESTFGPTRVVTIAPTWDSYYLLDPASLEMTRYETPSA